MNPHPHVIPRLGLTGGIGSGKSTALAYLSEMGAAVISSDAIVHELYEHAEIADAIRVRFGSDVSGQGAMDRAALARIVFADDEGLAWLEALLHPHVRRRIEEWAAEQEGADPQPALLAAEVPLLFETDVATDFDFTLVLTAPVGTRRRRLASKFAASDLAHRLARQMPEEEKIARSDFAFENVGGRKELRDFLGETVTHILAAGANAARPRA
ncbi:MAG TPA: dephospho-CoA kinase [Thermoleophilia bacterium]|nr:dephospho-CoA kinase [Thermoleophilia bacterium]